MAEQEHEFRHRVHNGSDYKRALINGGRLALWFDEDAASTWRNSKPNGGPDAPRTHSDTAIQRTLVELLHYLNLCRPTL